MSTTTDKVFSEQPENGSTEKAPRLLDENETRILDEQLETSASKAGFLAIYRYATALDFVCIAVSLVACAAGGISIPLMMVVMGALAGSFSDNVLSPDSNDFVNSVNHNVLYFVYIGVAQLVLVTLGMYGLNFAGERITKRLREAFLAAVLRQNVAFFDRTGAGEITVRISNDMNLVQDGISQKIGIVISGVAGFFAAIIVSFIEEWRLALVLLCVPLVIIAVSGGCGATMRRFQETATSEYARSSSFAEEVISCIRNVVAFGSQRRLLAVYERSLATPERADFMAQNMLGILLAAMFSVINLAYGQAAPHLAAIVQAGAAASRILSTIERHSPIDTSDDAGEKPEAVSGAIEFRDIKMVYPSRPDQVILDNFHLSIPAGKTVAVVGPSGSGKTTLVSLLERLYPPLRGEITLDGVPIRHLNLRWLRSRMGLVAQDNFLFHTSIYDNIAYGLGPEYSKVLEAAKVAHAHEFIEELPDGYQTNIGDRGSRLSGGQRQRIAIARAIISDPKVLLLDEATAALDTQNERLVQEALFSAAQGRTTMIVAHRLSTIRRADMIVVMDKGRVTESGTHDQLMAAQSTYASLVKAQQLRRGSKTDDDDTEVIGPSGPGTVSPASRPAAAPGLESAGEVARVRVKDTSLANLTTLVWRLNAPEKYYLIAGLLCSVIAGSGYPIIGIFFGNAIIAFTAPELANGGHSINFWSLMFLILGIVLLFTYALQGYVFAVAGTRLGSRARKQALASMLRQDIAFFDREENAPGTLTAFLSEEATKLRGIGGATLGAVANSVISLVGGIAVACSFGWKLGLVATACMPILLLCGFLRFWIISRTEIRFKRTTTAAAKACEAVSAIQTVAALGMEDTIRQQYNDLLKSEYAQNLIFDLGAAFTYALSMTLVQFVNALIFWYGGTKLIGSGEYTVRQFFICYASAVFSAQGSGAIFSFAPEIAGAQEAAGNLRYLLDSNPTIEMADAADGSPEKSGVLMGDVELRKVGFSYPTRPEYSVLHGIDMEAHKGQLVALVGGSGSGKSTVISLLERFYDPTSGTVLADHQDLRSINLPRYRKQVALVQQESPLVGGTIRECLLSDDENVDDEAIERACREANIFDFVTSLPEGLNTLVGSRGNRVSGGQKQRLAIAKALLRNPKILLLDEATSALDSESEKLVQHTLDAAATGRTTISVSHRISSITHADCIFVFDHGRIVESGNHTELLAKKGRYFELVSLQDLGN
ncbi:hypothetical protein VTG60DRAFT_671 [Thermothelomyces hinnuleus]